METSESELEQLVLNALTSHAEAQSDDEADTDAEEAKTDDKAADSKTDDKTADAAKTETKADDTPAWFKAFADSTTAAIKNLNEGLKTVASKTAKTQTDTAKTTEKSKSTQEIPLWLQNPKNAKLLAKYEAGELDLEKYNPVTGKMEE